MRPVSARQNVIRCPLNELLGTEAHVRLLRVLADEVEGPLTAPDIAKRAGLSVPGARKALKRLAQSGFVDLVGGGRRQQYALAWSEPLVRAAVDLFRAERQRYDELLQSLSQEVQRLSPPPHSVWIQEFPVRSGDPLEVGLLHTSKDLSRSAADLRRYLTRLEQESNVTIEISKYTRADLPDLEAEKITLVAGTPPVTNDSTATPQPRTESHRDLDQRSLERARALASLIEKDRSLIRRARAHLDRLLKEHQGTADRDLEEWRTIMGVIPYSSSAAISRIFQPTGFPLAPELSLLCDSHQGRT